VITPAHHKILSAIVIPFSIALAVILGYLIWDMNFWPSDERAYYFDAAVELPGLSSLSAIHQAIDEEKVRWLHGKEIFILFISWMQRLMGDTQTIRPFLMVCLSAICLSSILIFFIARVFWGPVVAILCYVGFTASAWPYIYVLFAKHQPLGLALFLLAVFVLQYWRDGWQGVIPRFFSGFVMGMSFFSSTVSVLYLPYYCAAILYFGWRNCTSQSEHPVGKILQIVKGGWCILAGMITMLIIVNWPDVYQNAKGFLEYVAISGSYNHFFYNQPHLQQWFQTADVGKIRGGWIWIVRYLGLIMPVLFALYWAGAAFLLYRLVLPGKDVFFRLKIMAILGLSLCAPIMAEIAQVAQYGANYFPAIIGVLVLLGYTGHMMIRDMEQRLLPAGLRWGIGVLTLIIILIHGIVNMRMFFGDIYPTRMVTTFLSRKIEKLKIERLSTYVVHPYREYFTTVLNPPVLAKIQWNPIRYIIQPQEGYILVPPMSGDTVYTAAISDYNYFDGDVFLNQLWQKGGLERYALASFPTMANSRIWLHEEEILSYRRLILGHPIGEEDMSGRVWLLDAAKLQAEKAQMVPSPEALTMHLGDLRNIGTRQRFYWYDGYRGHLNADRKIERLMVRLSKVGDPQDSLQAFVYRLDDQMPVWIPFGPRFYSIPVPARMVSTDQDQGTAVFQFDPPLELPKGMYSFMIYRTGQTDDEHFYRIHKDSFGLL
jgi:hypothetical protein